MDEAEACFRKELEINPRRDWTHHELGRILRERGRLDEAEACFRKAIEIAPKHFWSHFDLGDMRFAVGKVDEAIACYLKVAEINPQEEWAQRKCGKFLLERGRTEEADACFRKVIELLADSALRTKSATSYNGFAWLLVTCPVENLRDPVRAVDLARKAVELAPQAGYIWNTLGVAQYRAGDWKAAITALEKSMELRNGGDSSDWFFLGMCFWQQGDKDRARTWYKAARLWTAKYTPQNDEMILFRAEAAALMGLPETEPMDKTDELALGEALVEASPRASSYLLRGEAFANSEQWDRAADDFTKAIELGEKNFSAWYERALVQVAKEDKPGFQAACADMLKQFAQTEDARTAHFVAWSCALGPDALTDFAPAIALAEKAAKIDAKSAQFASSLGAILYRAGQVDEARQKLDEANRLASPADPLRSPPAYAWYFLAMTHHRLGHADEAKKWLDKAREEADKALKEHDAGTAKLAWNRRLTLGLLRREAEELLGYKQPPAPDTKQEDKPAD